jgi:mRNA-degrading endonuclease toxin of MazEF toxin-antitoxin module
VKRGDIYLVTLDPTLEHEQQGTRPVLVVSPDRFNALTRVPIVVPITSGGAFARSAGFTVSLTDAGTRTTGVVRCDQPRPFDLAARNGRKLESVPQPILDDVLAKLVTLFT